MNNFVPRTSTRPTSTPTSSSTVDDRACHPRRRLHPENEPSRRLPKLFNVVFAGNLSLVGPRPHALQAKAADRLYDEAVDELFRRHRVKPGITGWAQIHGWRGETNSQETQQRVEHDLYYIENWSILLDIFILLRTPFALLRTENAY